MHKDLKIIEFTPATSSHFYTINKEWIDDMFVLEDIDKTVLQEPQKYIIDAGGYIWFIEHQTHGIVGTCALLHKGDGVFELTKMGVLSHLRGLKLGETLLQHVLQFCLASHIKKVFLLTNKKCKSAIHLYKKLGFEHSQAIMQKYGKSYARCDVAMLLKQNTTGMR